jgi:hypothetical protein
MKRQARWSVPKKEERQSASEGGPLRRRRALRHLDSLALDPGRELNPAAAVPHVRVLGESGPSHDRPVGAPVVARRITLDRAPATEGDEPDTTVRVPEHRLHAVPIDQPLHSVPSPRET